MKFKVIFLQFIEHKNNGQSLVEILLAIALTALIVPALFVGFIAARQGKPQQQQRLQAITVLHQVNDELRSIRESGWTNFAQDGTFYPVLSGNKFILSSGTYTDSNGFTQQVVITDVYRDTNGNIVASGGTLDPSTKKAAVTVSWNFPYISSVQTTAYLTRYLDNLSYIQTTAGDFNADTLTQTQVVPTSPSTADASVTIANNTKAKWCSPSFSSTTISLPDGPPVAVDATASASTSIPNDVFVATAPYATSSVKLAYVQVTANNDPPTSSLKGIFTLDSTKYTTGTYPTGLGTLDNSFKTNAVKYYKSTSGKVYALLATTKPDHEVIAILVNDNNSANDNTNNGEYQDYLHGIFKYWTYFNTKIYSSYSGSGSPNYDQSPGGYGGSSLAILGNTGYVTSGGYLYAFDLTNIDTATKSTSLPMLGCRIQLDGYDCQPGPSSATDEKYGAGQTGTSYSDTTGAVSNTCADGGAVELFGDQDIYPVQVGTNKYIYVAVGGGADPEFDIANVTTPPTSGNSLTGNSCGRTSGGAAAWEVPSTATLDFDSLANTQESANSVYANSTGTRAYISSNGVGDYNGDGKPDSDQFYVIDTTSKTAPKFLSTNNSGGTAKTGYYLGTSPNNQLYPRQSLTVLNGDRVVLVGQDGVPNDGNNPLDYQVLNLDTEATPTFCGGLDFDQGFNDLTSVSEADGDNYVYMVANTLDHQLKVVQGGPDGTYLDQGTIESQILDVGYSTAFNRYSATFSTPANTSIKFQFAGADAVNGSCAGATYVYTGPDGSTGSYYTTSNGPIYLSTGANGYKNPARCFRYKAYLATTDYNATPVLNDMTVNYSP